VAARHSFADASALRGSPTLGRGRTRVRDTEDAMLSTAIYAGAISKIFWFLVILVILAIVGVVSLVRRAAGRR